MRPLSSHTYMQVFWTLLGSVGSGHVSAAYISVLLFYCRFSIKFLAMDGERRNGQGACLVCHTLSYIPQMLLGRAFCFLK